MELTRENIKDALTRGDFSLLKDQYENELLDVKESLYNLTIEHGREELCKDVSAMLNNNGGFILLGIKSENDGDTRRFDKITDVVGVCDTLDEEQYIQCINNGVYPEEPLVSIKKYNLDRRDVFCIEIPAGSTNRPFLRKKDNKFQYWIRTSSHATELNIARIHELSRKGIEYENHLLHMEETLDRLVERLSTDVELSALDDLKKEL